MHGQVLKFLSVGPILSLPLLLLMFSMGDLTKPGQGVQLIHANAVIARVLDFMIVQLRVEE